MLTKGEQISKWRNDKKLTLKEFGSLIGKSDEMIRKYEQGISTPPNQVWSEILEAMGAEEELHEQIGCFTNDITLNFEKERIVFSTGHPQIKMYLGDIQFTIEVDGPNLIIRSHHNYALAAIGCGGVNQLKLVAIKR